MSPDFKPLHAETPTVRSEVLSRAAGRQIWLKLEALQPSGSFKLRGIGLAAREYARRGARRLVCSSGGNAGIAAALAGRQLGLPVVVVVPVSTADRARYLIAREGAQVIVHGESWHEANELAQSMLTPEDAFVHPFDDPLLWRGHATLIDEVVRSGVLPDAVVVAVGGGGLLCGVVQGLHAASWPAMPLIAVETEGAHSLASALAAGHVVELDQITSVATSLGAKAVCQQAFELCRTHPISSVVVPDRAAVRAARRFLDDHRLLTEAACGAALSLAYDRHAAIEAYASVLIIVCGGATTTAERLADLAAQLEVRDRG